jgi:hypothetical protein
MRTANQKKLKLIHLASTALFIMSAAYLIVLALRQAGLHWWVIFSLSGYSVLFVMFLVSIYLFAMFKGVSRNNKDEIEHPLTSSPYYLVFYDVSPFLGAVAGGLAAIGISSLKQQMIMVTAGSLWATFFVWILIDPLAGSLEMLLPTSRKHRQERVRLARIARDEQEKEKLLLLDRLEDDVLQQKNRWANALQPHAESLVDLVSEIQTDYKDAEAKAIDIGLKAWRMGGINCMKQLHEMAIETGKTKAPDSQVEDFISMWWDGIGTWQNPSLPMAARKIS